MKRLLFCVHIFDISPCVFTQISIGRAPLMRNLILHPTSTHTAYFLRTPLPQKQEIPEKCDDDVIIIFFQVFLVFGVERSVKIMKCGYCWMHNQITHQTISLNQKLSKNTGRYVKNMNTKSSFFLSSSKINKYYFIILTIILLFSLGGPF